MDTLESLKRKIESAGDLQSVVRTMKAMAASKINEYDMANTALIDYYRTVEWGIKAWLMQSGNTMPNPSYTSTAKAEPLIYMLVFGSAQGLVGQFNDRIVDAVMEPYKSLPGKKMIWAVGDRIQLRLMNAGMEVSQVFAVPNAVGAITALVNDILVQQEAHREKEKGMEFYIFNNQPTTQAAPSAIGHGYQPAMQRLFPLDAKWKEVYRDLAWPTKNPPQVVGDVPATLSALIREYLFVSLFKACASSMASENASRLEAMQRAEKNIEEILTEFNYKYHHLRQISIDEELFDIVSGFEAMKKK